MACLLNIRDLTVCVKNNKETTKILDNINLTINEGEILGLTGKSGCGKSITALSIPGLLPQGIEKTDGDIFYKDRSLKNLTEQEMRSIRGCEISMIFQDVRQALNPLMKAGRQITETLELGGSKDKETNKNTALEMLSKIGFSEPERIFNAYPHQLSGGMCQRVMTAIAVIRRPKLLIADEPSSSLDEESQHQCLSLLKEMNQNHKMSLLVISHDLSIIKDFCSRYIVMSGGKITEDSSNRTNA